VATIEPVPELADRGFWYVVAEEMVEEPAGSGRLVTRPAGIPSWHSGWTATYIGDGTVVVRSPDPLVGVDALDASSAAKLIAAGEATRPYGRIRGR
jgi:hypothetical protein